MSEGVLGSLEQRLLLALRLSGSLDVSVAASTKRHDGGQIVVAHLGLLVVTLHVLKLSRQLGVVVSLHVSSSSSAGGVNLLADVGSPFPRVELDNGGLLERLDGRNVAGASSTCGSVYFVRRHFGWWCDVRVCVCVCWRGDGGSLLRDLVICKLSLVVKVRQDSLICRSTSNENGAREKETGREGGDI